MIEDNCANPAPSSVFAVSVLVFRSGLPYTDSTTVMDAL